MIVPDPPTRATLASYGLTEDDWWRMCVDQRCVCPICKKEFGGRKLVVDHEHVAGWRARKRKLKSGRVRPMKEVRVMTPVERRPYVRGILHAWCNGYVRVWLTLDRARSILSYLEAYESRKTL